MIRKKTYTFALHLMAITQCCCTLSSCRCWRAHLKAILTPFTVYCMLLHLGIHTALLHPLLLQVLACPPQSYFDALHCLMLTALMFFLAITQRYCTLSSCRCWRAHLKATLTPFTIYCMLLHLGNHTALLHPLLLQVLACPPQSCLDAPDTCSSGHLFTAKGIQGCGISTETDQVSAPDKSCSCVVLYFVSNFLIHYSSLQVCTSLHAYRRTRHQCKHIRT